MVFQPQPSDISSGRILWLKETALSSPTGKRDHPVLVLSAPTTLHPLTTTIATAVPLLLITTLSGTTSLSAKFPDQISVREKYIPLQREPAQPHPDNGALLEVVKTGRPQVPDQRQSYVSLSELFWVDSHDLQNLKGGSAKLTVDGMEEILENVHKLCSPSNWKDLEMAISIKSVISKSRPAVRTRSLEASLPAPIPLINILPKSPRLYNPPPPTSYHTTENTPLSSSYRSYSSYGNGPRLESLSQDNDQPSTSEIVFRSIITVIMMLLSLAIAGAVIGGLGYGIWWLLASLARICAGIGNILCDGFAWFLNMLASVFSFIGHWLYVIGVTVWHLIQSLWMHILSWASKVFRHTCNTY